MTNVLHEVLPDCSNEVIHVLKLPNDTTLLIKMNDDTKFAISL